MVAGVGLPKKGGMGAGKRSGRFSDRITTDLNNGSCVPRALLSIRPVKFEYLEV